MPACKPAKQACFFIHTTYWKLLAVQLRVSSAAAAGQKTKTKTKTKKKKKKRFSLIYFVCLGFFLFCCVCGRVFLGGSLRVVVLLLAGGSRRQQEVLAQLSKCRKAARSIRASVSAVRQQPRCSCSCCLPASAQDRDKLGFWGGGEGVFFLSFCYWTLLKDSDS